MTDPKAVLRRLEEIRAQTLGYLAGLSQEQLDWRPPLADGKEEWSLGEILMHLAIDEIYLREMIALPLLQGIQPPEDVGFLPPPPSYGTRKDVIEFWFERARWQTRRLFDDWPAGARSDLRHEGGLEAMNGLEWLEGYGGHEAYHHRQIEAVLAQLPEVPRE